MLKYSAIIGSPGAHNTRFIDANDIVAISIITGGDFVSAFLIFIISRSAILLVTFATSVNTIKHSNGREKIATYEMTYPFIQMAWTETSLNQRDSNVGFILFSW